MPHMLCFDWCGGLGERYKSKEPCVQRGEHQSLWIWQAWRALHLCHSSWREKKDGVPQSYSFRSLRHMDTISSHESVQKILIHAAGRWIGFELCIERELKEENYSKSESRSNTHQPDPEDRHCDITTVLIRNIGRVACKTGLLCGCVMPQVETIDTKQWTTKDVNCRLTYHQKNVHNHCTCWCLFACPLFLFKGYNRWKAISWHVQRPQPAFCRYTPRSS